MVFALLASLGFVEIGDHLSVRARDERDLGEIVSWVSDAEALYLFSGRRLRWPLTATQLQNMAEIPGLVASVVIAPSGELVGHFDLTIEERSARLGRVIVNPEFRGRGLGIAVVGFALAQARRRGAHNVRLNVVTTNEPAIRTYLRAGFAIRSGDPDRQDITVMERPLRADHQGSRVLVTGMSGAGKSTLLDRLAQRGYPTIDTDYDGWILADDTWDEPRMTDLLADETMIVVSGTVENQGRFYDRFDHVVLLSAPVDVLIERVRTRTTNPYGRSAQEQDEIRRYVVEVEPLLRASADLELDGCRAIDELADEIEALLKGTGSPSP